MLLDDVANNIASQRARIIDMTIREFVPEWQLRALKKFPRLMTLLGLGEISVTIEPLLDRFGDRIYIKCGNKTRVINHSISISGEETFKEVNNGNTKKRS